MDPPNNCPYFFIKSQKLLASSPKCGFFEIIYSNTDKKSSHFHDCLKEQILYPHGPKDRYAGAKIEIIIGTTK